MILKELVYQSLYKKNLFDKDVNIALNFLKKELGESKGTILTVLKDLQNDGRIGIKKDHTIYSKVPSKVGTFREASSKSGFIEIDGEEYFIKDRANAFNGDKIEVNFSYYKGRKEAFITKVVERQNGLVIGRIARQDGKYLFIPDTKTKNEFLIPQNEETRNAYGKKVAFKIDENFENYFTGHIEKVFGLAGDPIVENQAIAYEYGFVKEFNEKVENEALKISGVIPQEEFSKRLDLRHIPFVTIDGADCKDKDDAVYVEKTDNGYKVYVSIADVAYYVQKGTELDKEAEHRGTSCYLGDGVYPMFPERLSNDICSLNEGEDKLTLTTIINIDHQGNVKDYEIKKTVININKCLTYDILEDVYEDKNNARSKYTEVKDLIFTLYDVNEVLMTFRDKRGAIEFTGTEPTFVFDDLKTGVVDVINKNNTLSRKIIESLMVLANEAVGDYFKKKGTPVLYRIHDLPKVERMEKANNIFNFFGINFEGNTSQKNIKKFLEEVKQLEVCEYLNDLMIRCMDKAKYSPNNIGHYCLASKNYIHFTSPIRRYPDTLTHRILHDLIDGKKSTYSYEQMLTLGTYLSAQEKNASLAERKSDELLMAIWAENHIDEVIECTVYSIGKNSMKIKKGLIEIELPYFELPNSEYGYKPNQTRTVINNIKTKQKYQIGDKILVKILSSDRQTRSIYCSTDLTKTLNEEKQNTANQEITM